MKRPNTWINVLKEVPLVAILRGVQVNEVVLIGEALYGAGFRCIEVPLNSPRPLESIAMLIKALGDRVVVGAGTVLTVDEVRDVSAAGGELIVSPNANADVIRATKELGLISLPGVATATEAFAALEAGADGLKLFPAEAIPPLAVKALRAVLPPSVPVFPVGGIDATTMAAYKEAGATGFGFGSSLYKSGLSAEDVMRRAEHIVSVWRELEGA